MIAYLRVIEREVFRDGREACLQDSLRMIGFQCLLSLFFERIMKLIVNIPAYNEEAKIAETIGRIRKSFESDFYRNGTGRVITEKLVQVVDDGSSDKTAVRAKEAGSDLIVSYRPNRRLAYAFRRAVENALEHGADFMVNIDADGQFEPEEIPKLLEPVITGACHMTVGNRFGGIDAKDMPLVRSVLNRFAAFVVGFFLGTRIGDLTCGFRAHSREALLRLSLANIEFTYTQETIIDAIGKNLKVVWVPIAVVYHADREPKITKSVSKFVGNGFKIILRAVRDVKPMKFFGAPGISLILLSLILFIVFLFHYFPELEVKRYSNYLFASAALFLVGLQLVIFGLIADMIRGNRQLEDEILYRIRKDRHTKG